MGVVTRRYRFLVVFFVVDGLFLAVDFLAAEDVDLEVPFFAADELFFAALFFAVDELFLAAEDVDFAALFFAAVERDEEVGAFGGFFSPATTAFRSEPARKLGLAVFLARFRSPVCGLRTIREGMTFFSKAPKPVIATFSPLATSRVMVSTTDSRACCAAFLLPSN